METSSPSLLGAGHLAPRPHRWCSTLNITGFLVCLAGWIGYSVALDLLNAETARGWTFAIPLVVNGILCLPALYFWRRAGKRGLGTLFGAAMIGLLILSATSWHPRKVFVRDLESLAPGMSVAQVKAKMVGYRTDTPVSSNLQNGTATYLWDAPHGNYNADLGRVEFANGRVIRTTFLPD